MEGASSSSSASRIPEMSMVQMTTTADDCKEVREVQNYKVNVKDWIDNLPLEHAKEVAKVVEENKAYIKADNTIKKYMKYDKEFAALEVLGRSFLRYICVVSGGGSNRFLEIFQQVFGDFPTSCWSSFPR